MQKFKAKWGDQYSDNFMEVVKEISAAEYISPEEAKILMLERGINMKKDYIG
jgi:hypothetical protein